MDMGPSREAGAAYMEMGPSREALLIWRWRLARRRSLEGHGA